MTLLTKEQREIRASFINTRGYWAPFLDDLLELAPDFLEAYVAFSGVPWSRGTLAPKLKEFIYVAIDAATTHLYEPGLRAHIRNAFGHGATQQELVEVLELVSTIGINSCAVGMPLLIEELPNAGATAASGNGESSQKEMELRDRAAHVFGEWPPWFDACFVLAPDFLEAYIALAEVPRRNAALEPRFVELIYLAINVATTQLFSPAIHAHMRNALRHGATREEIVEVLELVSVLGIHSCTVGMPVLQEELRSRETVAISQPAAPRSDPS